MKRFSTFKRRSGAGKTKRFSTGAIALAGLAIICLLLIATSAVVSLPVQAAPIPVRYTEGMVRGFLELSDSGGKRIASGDFIQTSRGGEITARTVFHFKDGSLHDEKVVFTQQGTFLMKSYSLVQKGAAFEEDMEISLARATGKYRVKVKGKDGKEKVLDGKLDLPPDVYNGMIPTVTKNLARGGKATTVHMVAFTPAPKVIELEMAPSGEDKMLVGDLGRTAMHYVLKPKLGLLKLPAALLGRTPPDNHIWIATKDLPAFVKFVGPLAVGAPLWRIELTSPRWP